MIIVPVSLIVTKLSLVVYTRVNLLLYRDHGFGYQFNVTIASLIVQLDIYIYINKQVKLSYLKEDHKKMCFYSILVMLNTIIK